MKILTAQLNGIQQAFLSFCKALLLMLEQLEQSNEHSEKLIYWLEMALNRFEDEGYRKDVFATLISLQHDQLRFLTRYHQALSPALLVKLHCENLEEAPGTVWAGISLKTALRTLLNIPKTGFDSVAIWERDFLFSACTEFMKTENGRKVLDIFVREVIKSHPKDFFDTVKVLDKFLGDRERSHNEEIPSAVRWLFLQFFFYKPFNPDEQGITVTIYEQVCITSVNLFVNEKKLSKDYLAFLEINKQNIELMDRAKIWTKEWFDDEKISEPAYDSFLLTMDQLKAK